MMKKILFSLGIIGVSFLTGYATAQSYFVNNTPSTNAPGTSGPQSQNILSPSDFERQTQQLENNKKQAISDQFKQDLAKVPPTPPPPPPEAEAAMPEAGQTNTLKSNPPAAANPPATSAPIQEAAPSGPVPAAPPTSAPPQSKVYTGFQNPNQGESQNPPPGNNQNQPSSSSGGWNIKY